MTEEKEKRKMEGTQGYNGSISGVEGDMNGNPPNDDEKGNELFNNYQLYIWSLYIIWTGYFVSDLLRFFNAIIFNCNIMFCMGIIFLTLN